MISIFKKSGETDAGDLASSFHRTILLLLEASAVHAVEYDREDFLSFQTSVRTIAADLGAAKSPAEVLVLAGEAIRTIESYNRGIERYVGSLTGEFRSIATMMAKSVAQLSPDGIRTVGLIEGELKDPRRLEKVREVKGKLSTALAGLSSAVPKQDRGIPHQTPTVAGSETFPALAGLTSAKADQVNPVTGLSGREGALAYARALLRTGCKSYGFAVRLERLAAINARFGAAIGDKILTMFSQLLAQRLEAADQLFHWRGPCFVAVVERSATADAVRIEATRLGRMRFDYSVDTGDRSVMLNLSVSGAFIPILGEPDLAQFAVRIENFANGQYAAEMRVETPFQKVI